MPGLGRREPCTPTVSTYGPCMAEPCGRGPRLTPLSWSRYFSTSVGQQVSLRPRSGDVFLPYSACLPLTCFPGASPALGGASRRAAPVWTPNLGGPGHGSRSQPFFKCSDIICFCSVLLSLAYGLRFAEAAALTPRSLGHGPRPTSLTIRPVKQRPGAIALVRRDLTHFLAYWAALLRQLVGHSGGDIPFCGHHALRTGYAKLQAGTDAADMGFHCIRRGAARYLHCLGHPLASVAA